MATHEEGEVIKCPACGGTENYAKNRCKVCDGRGRVEYRCKSEAVQAPAGSWMPTRLTGNSGKRIVIFGPAKQDMTR